VVNCLQKAKRRTYLSDTEFSNFYSQVYTLMNSMGAFRATLKTKAETGKRSGNSEEK